MSLKKTVLTEAVIKELIVNKAPKNSFSRLSFFDSKAAQKPEHNDIKAAKPPKKLADSVLAKMSLCG